jgi:hypothetical protein
MIINIIVIMDVQALVAANALSAETLPRITSLTKQTDAKGGRSQILFFLEEIFTFETVSKVP